MALAPFIIDRQYPSNQETTMRLVSPGKRRFFVKSY